jgi:hypothetical protein
VTTALATVAPIGAQIEQVLVNGNLSSLNPDQRISYYNAVCASVGLNPLTRPFEYITLNGKLVLYARRDCADQLRKIHGVSITIAARELVEGVYVVTARATTASGRCDEAIGAVPIDGLKGEARANAMMKAETKAKRRVTLSVCGLGMLDENEVDSIPGAHHPVPPAEAPPKWTAGTENAPKREPIRDGGFTDPAEVDITKAEYTEKVDVIDANTGEVVGHEDAITSAQGTRIHVLLHELRNQYTEVDYQKHLKKVFCKEKTNELSTREAAKVLDGLLRRYERIRPEIEAHAAEQERLAAEGK